MILYNIKNNKYNKNISLNTNILFVHKQYIRFFTFRSHIVYNNSWLNKPNVLKENKNKSGVYR